MPGKNTIKVYAKDSYYHIYNRGVEKRDIFLEDQDYRVFLNYLKQYLSPPPDLTNLDLDRSFVERLPKNYHDSIELVCFNLMPNHFHLLLKQNEKMAIAEFMQSLLTRYCIFFNKKHKRVGSLYQGRYKGILIDNDEYLIHLTRYIHLNSKDLYLRLEDSYSSYSDYLGLRDTSWLTKNDMLAYFNKQMNSEFKKINNYQNFVESEDINSEEKLGNLTLEN